MINGYSSLGQVADFINGFPFGPDEWGSAGIPIIRIQNLTNPDKPFTRTVAVVPDKYRVNKGDLLVSWSGTLGVFEWNREECGLVNQHIFRVVPNDQVAFRPYLKHVIGQAIKAMARFSHGSTMRHINREEFLSTRIWLPRLEEQKRIATILDKANAIRRKRGQAIKLADEFLRALFVDMFGDPVRNPKGWPQKPLRDCVEMANGSTPPKEVAKYWNGSVPWVSPKDMKFREITGSIDHVSELAVSDQTVRLVPSGTVLIVIRGMILAHTVPIAITSVECTINQDMKALRPNAELDAVFLEAALRTMHNSLLAKVSTSTHGTKKLDSERLRQILLPIPPRVSQEKFRDMTRIMNKTHSLAHGCREAASSLRDSLVDAAFRCEL